MHELAGRPSTAKSRGLWPAALGWVLALILMLAFWWLASESDLTRAFLPHPGSVLAEAARLMRTGVLLDAAAQTVGRLTAGVALGAALGMGLARIGERSALLRSVIDPAIAMGRAVPSVAWLALVAVVAGTGEASTLIAVALVTAMVSFDRASAAVDDSPRRTLLTSRGALAQAWAVEIAAEMLGADHGLGSLLRDGGFFGRPERVFVAVIALAALGWASGLLLTGFRRLPLDPLRPSAGRSPGRVVRAPRPPREQRG